MVEQANLYFMHHADHCKYQLDNLQDCSRQVATDSTASADMDMNFGMLQDNFAEFEAGSELSKYLDSVRWSIERFFLWL